MKSFQKKKEEEEHPLVLEPTLSQYHAYHSMVCTPSTACQCTDSFNGSILFVSAADDKDDDDDDTLLLLLQDCTRFFRVVSYYILVILSFTGVSTIFGWTECIERNEIRESEQPVLVWQEGKSSSSTRKSSSNVTQQEQQQLSPHLGSTILSDHNNDPSSSTTTTIAVSMNILQYLITKHSYDKVSDLRIVRKFEYNFRLVGLHVIMCHLKHTTKGDKDDDDDDGLLHLVEVYHFRNSIVRSMAQILSFFLTNYVFPIVHHNDNDDKKKKNE